MSYVNFEWFSTIFGSHGGKLVKNYDKNCLTEIATSLLSIIRVFRNGDLYLTPAAFDEFFKVRPSPHRNNSVSL
jgi:hypothetical protein